jgi:tetratricopeptide (TPR) repeat protein
MRKRVLILVANACFLLGAVAASADNVPPNESSTAVLTRADIMLSTAQSFIQANEYQKALTAAEELTATYSNYPSGWMMLGYCRMLNGDFQGSNEAYDHAASIGANKTEIFNRQAYNYIKLEDWAHAKQCYQKLVELDASNTDALTQLAYFESKLGDIDGAVLTYRKVLEIIPNNTKVIAAIAKIEEKRGAKSEVQFWLEKGLAIEPDNPLFLKKYSVLLLNDQKFKEALPYLEKLIEVEPESAVAYGNLGLAYYALDRKGEAKAAFAKARELGGDLIGLFGPMAESYRVAGDKQTALEVIQEGLQAGDQMAWLYCIWGKILEERKDFDGATAKFRKAVELKERPWDDYATKQIARQAQLKKRAELMAAQAQSDYEE